MLLLSPGFRDLAFWPGQTRLYLPQDTHDSIRSRQKWQ